MRMLDSITVANLPPGADAYAAYVDGHWPTLNAVKARFPHAHILSIAVFPGDDAECLDVESGDASIASIYGWFRRQQRRGVWRPCIYTSAANLSHLIATMEANGFHRSAWRCWSAHYGAGKHICGPGTCGYPQADGTQWRDDAPGAGGSRIDESLLLPDFFGAAPKPPAPHPVPQEDEMPMLTNGTGAQTVISFPKGSAKGISFANDATLTAQPVPVLRVAAHSAAGHFQTHILTLTPSGKDGWAWDAGDVDFLSVSRAGSNGGDAVAVGWNLT